MPDGGGCGCWWISIRIKQGCTCVLHGLLPLRNSGNTLLALNVLCLTRSDTPSENDFRVLFLIHFHGPAYQAVSFFNFWYRKMKMEKNARPAMPTMVHSKPRDWLSRSGSSLLYPL